MTEKSGTPAPAAEPSAPAVAPPSERQGVDLSDLQAEIDSISRQTDEDEIFNDISRTGPRKGDDDESDEDESDAGDEDEGDNEQDVAAEDKDEEKDDDADAEGKSRKRSRS